MTRLLARATLAYLGIAMVALAAAPQASADAAGPTDYNTEIVSVEPATSAIHVEMIGGDSFFSLEQREAVDVTVLGYQAEPYLRFEPDGSVFENRRSPSVWLNQERYGTNEPPAYADAKARPEWVKISSNGRYAWHDHRSHWMNPQRPPGAEPGDQVLEATIPLDVGGVPVTVTVASYLLEGPSTLPVALGSAASLLLAGVALNGAKRHTFMAATCLVALAAAALGVVAFFSVPGETEPSPLLWLLPAIAVAASALLLLIRNRTATTVYLDGLMVAGGAALAGWMVFRRSAIQRALIPSDAPASLDRFVIVMALIVGLVTVAQGVRGLVRPQRLIEPASNL